MLAEGQTGGREVLHAAGSAGCDGAAPESMKISSARPVLKHRRSGTGIGAEGVPVPTHHAGITAAPHRRRGRVRVVGKCWCCRLAHGWVGGWKWGWVGGWVEVGVGGWVGGSGCHRGHAARWGVLLCTCACAQGAPLPSGKHSPHRPGGGGGRMQQLRSRRAGAHAWQPATYRAGAPSSPAQTRLRPRHGGMCTQQPALALGADIVLSCVCASGVTTPPLLLCCSTRSAATPRACCPGSGTLLRSARTCMQPASCHMPTRELLRPPGDGFTNLKVPAFAAARGRGPSVVRKPRIILRS
jgi:hypothetical protein